MLLLGKIIIDDMSAAAVNDSAAIDIEGVCKSVTHDAGGVFWVPLSSRSQRRAGEGPEGGPHSAISCP